VTTAKNKSPPKHTPGPWEYDGDGFDSVAAQDCGTDGYIVFPRDKDGDPDAPVCEISDRLDDDEAEANARLIAAAPELLNALQNLMNGIDTNMVRIETDADETLANAFHRIRTAIAKATGAA